MNRPVTISSRTAEAREDSNGDGFADTIRGGELADTSRSDHDATLEIRTGGEELVASTPEPARDRDRLATQLAIGIIALGFLFMFGAWFGASGQNEIQQQFPYLLSGSMIGLALVILGGGILVVRDVRRERDALEAQISRLATVVEDALDARGPAPRTAAPARQDVVLGRTAFHRPDCRLVQGKADLDMSSRQDALDDGLTPCRTCEP